MNVSFDKNNDAVSGILKLEIVKADYAEQLDKDLRSIRQKANVPGFRKGMVPLGMIKKMFGKQALVEVVNKLISENLFKYIRENDLHVLGEPMPNETVQKPLDFDHSEDFEFCFDLALAPETHIELSKNDQLPFYQVKVDDEMINTQVDSYRANFGSYVDGESVEEKDMVKGTVAELENGTPKEGGIVVENAVLMPMYIKNEEEKAKFIGANVNSVVVFNPNKAYEGAEAEIASFLHVEKEKVAELLGDFSFEVKTISRHQPAEMNQELFDKVFGEGVVTSEEEFKQKIDEALKEQFTPQSDFKFLMDIRDLLVERAGELKFDDALLKRWLLASNSKNTPEQLEKDYPQVVKDLTYQLIKDALVRQNDLKVTPADVEGFAKRVAKAQFAQYGMLSVPEDVLDNYAKEMLKNAQTAENIANRAIEEQVAAWLKEQVSLDEKEVSADEFTKLFE